MNAEEWEKFLVEATREVWERVSPLAKEEGRGEVVGTGAAGDATIRADKLAEDLLLKALEGAGKVRVLTEEAGLVGDAGSGPLALVDPIDGSSNFERGIPFYCTSVAIAEGETLGDISVGVVRDLVTGEVYSARRGRGALKGGRKIRTSGTTDPARAVVGVDLSRGPPGLTSSLAPLVAGVKRQVHLGANALELCYLAEGKIDSFVDLRGKIRITDFAAAMLIAREAGATITSPDGGELAPAFDLEHRFSFVASANPSVHRRVLEFCAPGGKGPA